MIEPKSLRGGMLLPPYLWLLLFFLAPFAIVLAISFGETRIGVPPVSIGWPPSLGSWEILAGDSLYLRAWGNSLLFAAIATLCCLLLGYPMAYAIARAGKARRDLLLLFVILPFWTSFLIRVYAWTGLLRPNGTINEALLALGLIDAPLPLMNNAFGVVLGLVYSYLPFMVLPLYATLEKLDPALLEAAADLGAPPRRAFLSVTLPLSLPGVLAGSLLVFVPAAGEFVVPDLLGGPDTLMIGKVLWDEFFTNRDWPVASALAVSMLALLGIPVALLRRAFTS
jgi:putrescine transport system permease protein